MTIDAGAPVDALVYDYLAGLNGRVLRRRKIPGATNNEVSLVQDKQGSTINLAEPDSARMSTGPGYTFDAWGQSFQSGTSTQPSPSNNIRYHGGFVESFLSTNDKDDIYRMGARHYSTVIGRFLQRDPLLLNVVPNAVYPLALNPYIYALNRPTYLTDTSGWAPGGSCCGGGHPPNPGFKPEPARPPFPVEPGGGVGGPSFPLPCGISPYTIMYFMGDMSGGDSGPQPGLHSTTRPACVKPYYDKAECCPGWDPLHEPEGCCCIMGYYANTEKHWPKKIVPLVDDCCGFRQWKELADPEADQSQDCKKWCCGQVYEASSVDSGSGGGSSQETYFGRGGHGPNPYIPTLPMKPPIVPGGPGNQPGGLDPGFQIPGVGSMFGETFVGGGLPAWSSGIAEYYRPFDIFRGTVGVSAIAIAIFCSNNPMHLCCCTIWDKSPAKNLMWVNGIANGLELVIRIPGPAGFWVTLALKGVVLVTSAWLAALVAAWLKCKYEDMG